MHGKSIDEVVSGGKFLVVGGAGSIGSAVVREIFKRDPHTLHVIDNSENSLAELVRDLRSSLGYIAGDFHAYCFDVLGGEFQAFAKSRVAGDYDYVLNFSALKHVRSEKDPFTLMRLIDVNIFLTLKLLNFSESVETKKFFCVSTDKAANPVNMMGASKRIMELFLFSARMATVRSTARFANVAFSNGSLPQSWKFRLEKRQPIVAPTDVRRYFLTSQESAVLCLFSILQGQNREVYFPKLDVDRHLVDFRSMAESYLRQHDLVPVVCESEEEARGRVEELASSGRWPCFFFRSDTTGEKEAEEFFTSEESVNWQRYSEIGIVSNQMSAQQEKLDGFSEEIRRIRECHQWTKADIVDAFGILLPEFHHRETGKNLDNRM